MGDDVVNTAHEQAHELIRMSRGLAGVAVEVGVIAGLVHAEPAGAKPQTLDALAQGLEAVAGGLRRCAGELRGAEG